MYSVLVLTKQREAFFLLLSSLNLFLASFIHLETFGVQNLNHRLFRIEGTHSYTAYFHLAVENNLPMDSVWIAIIND